MFKLQSVYRKFKWYTALMSLKWTQSFCVYSAVELSRNKNNLLVDIIIIAKKLSEWEQVRLWSNHKTIFAFIDFTDGLELAYPM